MKYKGLRGGIKFPDPLAPFGVFLIDGVSPFGPSGLADDFLLVAGVSCLLVSAFFCFFFFFFFFSSCFSLISIESIQIKYLHL